MAIRVYLEGILKERGMTSKELCAKIGITEANYLQCDIGDILKFDGNLEDEEDE